MDLLDLVEYRKKGYNCSQVINCLVLETIGVENPMLIKAMKGLGVGIAGTKNNCGCLSGGACAMSLCLPDDMPNRNKMMIIQEFTAWFEAEYGTVDCKDIVYGDLSKHDVCPPIIIASYEKILEILSEKELLP